MSIGAHGFVSAMDLTMKIGLHGASAAYRTGVARGRVRAEIHQARVNAYTAAALRNRAAARHRAADAERDAKVAALLGRFGR